MRKFSPHIVFVYPPATLSTRERFAVQFNGCLGAGYIIAYLKKHGWRAGQFLSKEPVNAKMCAAKLLALKPQIVGFTVYPTNYCACQLIAKAIKSLCPSVIVLFGGPTPTVQARTILERNEYVDICVRNEGEEICLELVSAMDEAAFNLKRASGVLSNIKGISYRTNGYIRENPPSDILIHHRKVPGYLDRYPSPYLEGVIDSPELGIITARGCTRHCVYCNCAVISKRIIAAHSVDRVVEELDYISNYLAVKSGAVVDIFDDAFTLNPDRAMEICQRLIDNKINVPLVCATRCDAVSEELLLKMKEAGFKGVGFALESAVPRILRQIGKVQPTHTRADETFQREKEFIEKLVHYVRFAKKIGFHPVHTSIMLGLPGETVTDGKRTMQFIRSLGDDIDFYSHNLFQVYPGTPVFESHQRGGLSLFAYDNGIHFKTIHPYDTSQIRPSQKSNVNIEGLSQDRVNLKYLSLPPGENGDNPQKYDEMVTRVILMNGIIDEKLVTWLQSFLAINGQLIQIYPNLECVRQYRRHNENIMRTFISPTNYHAVYYYSQTTPGHTVLSPYRLHVFGPQCGFSLHLADTSIVMDNELETFNAKQTLCMENPGNKDDVHTLVRLLSKIESAGANFDTLANHPVYPYFSNLCRWEQSPANCRLLHTLIIDETEQVKTCWNGASVGTVGTPLHQIKETLDNLLQKKQDECNCNCCPADARCAVCLFPEPLDSTEYCNIKKKNALEKSAELLRAFDVFKELQ